MAMALKYFVATVTCFEKYIENKISKAIIFYQWIQVNRNLHAYAQTVNAVFYVSGTEKERE